MGRLSAWLNERSDRPARVWNRLAIGGLAGAALG